jgi:hypothetical protein
VHRLARVYVERHDPLSDNYEPLPTDFSDPDALRDARSEQHGDVL